MCVFTKGWGGMVITVIIVTSLHQILGFIVFLELCKRGGGSNLQVGNL